jgi:hypothetical protein
MKAAVADQDGGEEVASNRAISEGDEIASLKAIALFAAAVGIQQQVTIATAHHGEAEPDEARGPIAERARNPVSSDNCIVVK